MIAWIKKRERVLWWLILVASIVWSLSAGDARWSWPDGVELVVYLLILALTIGMAIWLVVTHRRLMKVLDDRPDVRLLGEYVEHASWRCTYRSRYPWAADGSCNCGLVGVLREFGLDEALADVQDPEAKP